MKIVVTGSEGFIGRRVAGRLLAAGHDVLGIDVQNNPNERRGYAYVQADLSRVALPLITDWSRNEAFCLIHLAWNMNRRSGYAEQVAAIALFARLLDEWRVQGLSRVIGLGSAEEYGDLEGALSVDLQPMRFLSPYGWAKQCAFEMLRDWSLRYEVPSVWLRPFVVYGEDQRGDMLIPYALRCAQARTDACFTTGEQFRDFVHVDDVATGVQQALALETNGVMVFNLGLGKPVRVLDVLKRIADQFGVEDLFHFGKKEMRPGEPFEQYADLTDSKRLLGWEPEICWQDGIDRLCAKN